MTFDDFLKTRFSAGGFSTADTLASLLPLLRQVVAAHEAGQIAPLRGTGSLLVEDARVYFVETALAPAKNQLQRVREIQAADRGPLRPASGREAAVAGGENPDPRTARSDHSSAEEFQSVVRRPVFLTGYICWEQLLEHHDPLTDVFCLGQILASLALRLDFHDPGDVEKFVEHRKNLFAINADLHPVIARAIVRMTELHREDRPQDLSLLVRALENYRQQDVEISVEPAAIEGFESRDLRGKQQVLLDRLQKRLFEISRRNRLLHFRPTMQSVNLTQASVPLSFDYRNIREDQIMVCDRKLEQQIASGRTLSLNRRLDFSEAIYLSPQLDRILRETRRDMAEYGFVPLRLVLCMLHWANLKESPPERFRSPLVLVSVRLKKKRGVRDTWSLEPVGDDAEINPVVRYLFKQWYDIRLPETIELEQAGIEALFQFLSQAIGESEPAVELRKQDRPPIRPLHAAATKRLDNYRRRARISGRGVRTWRGIDYSYDPATWHPLGIRVFSQFMRPPEVNQAAVRQSVPRPRHYALPDEEDTSERKPDDGAAKEDDMAEEVAAEAVTREMRQTASEIDTGDPVAAQQEFREPAGDGHANPYNWCFDLCSVTLANFRYRKMSLVRDYEALVEETPHNAPFEAVFSLTPRFADQPSPATPPLADRYDVVPCDPTQATSITQARAGGSYIVQGPPGTGKSQTITNLIADYAARGQRVLFVCEKRAAIDVVFARLKKCGLGDLCCLIHDSQADKKAFVMDLKRTFESFQKKDSPDSLVEAERTDRVTRLLAAMQPLEDFSRTMQRSTIHAGVATAQLIDRAMELRDELPELGELQKEQLPAWRSWNQARPAIESLVENLRRHPADGILARHPLRNLRPALARDPKPLQTVTTAMEAAQTALAKLQGTLEDGPLPLRDLSLPQIRKLVDRFATLAPLARAGALVLLDPDSQEAAELDRRLFELEARIKQLEQARQHRPAWKQKISRRDLPDVMESVNAFSRTFLSFFWPSWWRLRAVMKRSYDFAAHPIRPSWISVLKALRDEYRAEDEVGQARQSIAGRFHLTENPDDLLSLIEATRREAVDDPDWLRTIYRQAISGETAATQVLKLAEATSTLRQLDAALDRFLETREPGTCQELASGLVAVGDSLDQLPDYLDCLELLQNETIPESVRSILQRLDRPPRQIEAAVAFRSLELVEREDRQFRRFDQADRSRCVSQLAGAHQHWMQVNADFTRQQTRRRFLQHARQSTSGSVAAGPESGRFQKSYREGLRILEHEFGKQMRYKSIRDLVSGDSGAVVRDLKPVWLMSPLGVSDTLPLGEQDFDVVIFDEASQITLEASIPSLFRATQAIVVGDEQQLPPTDFFSARTDREEDGEITFEHEGQTVAYDLESNSLLNHAARNLPSTMLGWHYRSRDEALISFSNRAFYHGRLLTIPEETILTEGQPPLVAGDPQAAVAHAETMFERPISFHRMENGVYLRRRNREEADYIARLVCQILKKQDGRTIGVIAFSEAQQDEIEEALDRLAKRDAEFSVLLEAELVREDDGQFVGLLVKNLENIQGDERDIVILGICYGPDDNGRMIMNFGPINQSGGEKRLNVAFSRAKHHMAIVSSIRYPAITNEYNRGANCLRNYLRYAEAVSAGDTALARSVLNDLSPWHDSRVGERPLAPALQRIAGRLRDHDLLVDYHIGHSDFRCDLGVRKPGDTRYRLGILVDAGDYYSNGVELLDRELFRPRLLEIFGWNTYAILLKDWLQDADRLVGEILALCQDVPDPPAKNQVDATASRDVPAPPADPDEWEDEAKDESTG